MRHASIVAACLLASCASRSPVVPPDAAAAGDGARNAPRSGLLLAGFDRTVRPQDDLYLFTGGTWLASTAIPPDKSNYGTFGILTEQSELELRGIAERAAAQRSAPGTDAQKIGDFYASFMDVAAIDAAGITPLAAEFARIEAIRTRADLARFFGAAQRELVRTPIGYYVAQDQRDATRYIGILSQSGLSMPDRDYYLKDDATHADYRAQHLAYIEKLLTLAGERDAAAQARRIAALETSIAKAHWSKVQNRDPVATYNKNTLASIGALAPALDWGAFFAGAGVPSDAIDVNQPTYVKGLAALAKSVPLADWKAYLRFQTLDVSAPYLGDAFALAHFEFHDRALRGVERQPERWLRGVRLLDRAIGELLGKLYVAENFRPQSKERMLELVNNLLRAFEVGIDELDWMTPATRLAAKEKLAKFTVKIGYPDRWRDYSALDIEAADLYGNLVRSSRYAFQYDVDKLGKPIDRDEWLMTPQTVNAYYLPVKNEIVFPAAILQPPYFDPEADDAVNYGAIGAVIGHEISHGFDDSGRQYDGDGNLRDWWTMEDAARFRKLAGALVAQYDAYTVLDGQHLNGKLTLGENIGDLSGLSVAYEAYRLSLGGREAPVIDGFTGPQRFFLGWSQSWRRKHRDNDLRMRLVTDPHSPSEFRVNAVVTNMDAFYKAFGVREGDGLYLAPADRVKIW